VGWEGLRSGGASQLRALNRGQSERGACRSERLVGGQHVPDRLGQPTGQIHLGDLRAALAAQPSLRAPVALGVDRVTGGVHGRLDQRPAQVLGPVLGQWAAVVLAPGLVDPRTHPRRSRPTWPGWRTARYPRSRRRWCSRAPSRSRERSAATARSDDQHPRSAGRARTRRPPRRAGRSNAVPRWCRRPRVRAAPAGPGVPGRRPRTGRTPGTGGRRRAGWRGSGSSARCGGAPGAAATGRVPARRAPSGWAARSPAPNPGATARPTPTSRSCRSCQPAGPAP
jgi:hypothetical protein